MFVSVRLAPGMLMTDECSPPRPTPGKSTKGRRQAMSERTSALTPEARREERAQCIGACVCGAVRLAIDVPAVWAWHDHSGASRHAQGCAYATYVGSWKSRFRILEGSEHISHYRDEVLGTVRGFCGRCGTPLTYERSRAPRMVNLPRALFAERTGREPRYHMHLSEAAEWTYMGEAVAPLKGYPGVMRERSRKRRPRPEAMFQGPLGLDGQGDAAT
jgi:hypothetical protein